MKDLKILEIMELFDEGEVTTADKIDPPENPYKEFEDRNPMAAGGMLVQPGFGGVRQGYKEEKFISGPGTGVTALDDPKKYKIVKKYLNKVKTQKNKRIFLDWSEQIKNKPNPWYEKLKGEVKLTRQPLNQLINKVITEEFPTAYSGVAGKAKYAREMTVKSFINYWNQNGMLDGNEKLAKPLEQFVTSKKGTPNNYENINRYFTEWKEGKFEVDGVNRKNLDKGLLQAIKKWSPSRKSKRSLGVTQQLIYLNKLNPNLSYDRVANLFAQKFPDNAQTLQHRLNQLTELKRNGVYNDGTGNPKKIPGIGIGERSGWLKEGYGKGFLGNYGRLIKKADELRAAGESKFAIRLEKAADKFFGPTGIFTKAAGEGEHPLSRNMGDGPVGNQLKINSLVSSDLNQFKKFNFDSPVRNLVLEYENPNTTSVRKKEIKLEIENRKKLMNILTEGPNQKGIVDSVKFNYGTNKITGSVDVPDIDKIKNFDINEFITRGEDYRTSILQKGKNVGLIDKGGQIIKQNLSAKQIAANLRKLDFKCKFAGSNGGIGSCDDPMSYVDDIKKQEDLLKIQKSKAPQATKTLNTARKINAVRSLFTQTLGPGALAFEAAAALPIAYMGYQGGKTPVNILGDATYGLLGKSDQRILLDKAIELGYDTSNIKNVQDFYKKAGEFDKQAARADEFMGPDDMFMYPQMVQKAERDLFDSTRKFLDPKTGEQIPERVAAFNQLPLVEQAVAKDQTDLAAKRQERVGGFLQSPVTDYLPGLAGGGIAKMAGVDQGPPPESGPNSQGLQGLMKRVRNL